MAYQVGTYKSAFWETDFLSHVGFNTLSSHMKTGQKNTKSIEEYLKLRVKAEEDYSKTLLRISKNVPTDFGTFGKFLGDLHKELEAEASFHSIVASRLQEELAKLSEFREKQKEERKKNEDVVQKAHKTKVDLYRAMINSKKECDSKVKAVEKAEVEVEKPKPGAKPKEIERAKKNLIQTRQSAEKANENYKLSVASLEASRHVWETEHARICDLLQQMEIDRIEWLKNCVWVFSNVISDMCCQVDDSRENIRLAAEKCIALDDVRNFAVIKSYCAIPLQPIDYIPPAYFGNKTEVTYATVSVNNRKPSTQKSSDDEWDDDPVNTDTYTAQYDYSPRSDEEMELKTGEQFRLLSEEDHQGWVQAVNLTSQNIGLVPMSYLTVSRS